MEKITLSVESAPEEELEQEEKVMSESEHERSEDDAEAEAEEVESDDGSEKADDESGDDTSEEDSGILAKMHERMEAANMRMAKAQAILQTRGLDVLDTVSDESVQNAARIEDRRDELQEKLDAGEITELEFAQEMTEPLEALANIIEAWERTTAGKESDQEEDKAA